MFGRDWLAGGWYQHAEPCSPVSYRIDLNLATPRAPYKAPGIVGAGRGARRIRGADYYKPPRGARRWAKTEILQESAKRHGSVARLEPAKRHGSVAILEPARRHTRIVDYRLDLGVGPSVIESNPIGRISVDRGTVAALSTDNTLGILVRLSRICRT